MASSHTHHSHPQRKSEGNLCNLFISGGDTTGLLPPGKKGWGEEWLDQREGAVLLGAQRYQPLTGS
jgi:hypothetical protein